MLLQKSYINLLLYMVAPRPMDNGIVSAKGYEAGYIDIVNRVSDFMAIPAENLVRIIKQESLQATNPAQLALDFGSGDGRHSKYLHDIGYQVFATDVSEGAIAATKLRMKDLKIETALLGLGGDRLPLADGKTSLALGWEVLHWLGSKELFVHYMNEFKRVLKPGGHLVFTMPKEDHYLKLEALEVGFSQYQCTAHDRSNFIMYAPNLVTIKSMMSALGFEIKRVKSFSHSDSNLEGRSLEHPFSMYALYCTRT